MHYFEEQCQISLFVVIYFKTMCNKTMIRFVFVISGIIKVSVSVMSLVLSSTLIIPDITKTSPNNCFSYCKPPLIPLPTDKPHHLLP